MASDAKFYTGYSRWIPHENTYETWEQAVARVMNMHREKYAHVMTPTLESLIQEAQDAYNDQLILGAQRALQFAGPQLRKHEAKMYNCSSSHCDRATFFQEAMYLLLCGCGVGFSVQRRHVNKLPPIHRRNSANVKVFEIEDSIEGWAKAFGVLISSFVTKDHPFPEYANSYIYFDFSQIRPKGAEISGGFKAPGPDPLRAALIRCESLLNDLLAGQDEAKMRPIIAYDFMMHMSDAVLAGGVRRSATICVFDKDDTEMLNAKTGNWFETNPQRGRSNNSAMLVRDDLTREEWSTIMKSVRDFGEPGFVFATDPDHLFNPCVEIGMRPICVETGESGFQFCNLVETAGAKITSVDVLKRACRAGAILGTLQAGYTDFKFVSDATRRITEREALLGVSITGWMNSPDILFDEDNMRMGAEIVKSVNKEVAALIGIRPSARSTCTKPAGNTSVLLECASGIHGEHAPLYFRNVQFNKDEEIAKVIQKLFPQMCEESVWSTHGTDIVVSFPIISKEGSIYKRDLLGVRQLEFVRKAQRAWVEYGTDKSLCVDPTLRHNISNTISMGPDDWAEVEEYIYQNRYDFAGISLLAAGGDKAYVQAPFLEVFTAEQIFDKYGEAALYASGLIVDGMHAFNNNLWRACSEAQRFATETAGQLTVAELFQLYEQTYPDVLQRDWVRRYHKFAVNYTNGDLVTLSECLKDCHNRHRWMGIARVIKEVDFVELLKTEKEAVDVNTLGAIACAGGACEWTPGQVPA